MLEAKTKVVIESKEPFIKDFNGQQASATDKVGAVTGRQMFDIMNSGGLFLSESDYKLVA